MNKYGKQKGITVYNNIVIALILELNKTRKDTHGDSYKTCIMSERINIKI